MEPLINDQWAAMGEFDHGHHVKLIIDEWGCWHPKGTELNPHHLFEQKSCLRDALCAALTLDTFNRHADKLDMANVAQLVNNIHTLFHADGDKFVATPNFYVFEMYRPHHDAQAVRMDVQAHPVTFNATGPKEIFRVAGSASRADHRLTVTLVHTHVSEPAEVDPPPGWQLRGERPPHGPHASDAQRAQHVRQTGRSDPQNVVDPTERIDVPLQAGAGLNQPLGHPPGVSRGRRRRMSTSEPNQPPEPVPPP